MTKHIVKEQHRCIVSFYSEVETESDEEPLTLYNEGDSSSLGFMLGDLVGDAISQEVVDVLPAETSIYHDTRSGVVKISGTKGDYDNVVAGAAEDLLGNIDTTGWQESADTLTRQLEQEYEQLENMHPWILDENKCVLILLFSSNQSAEAFHHGVSAKNPQDQFRWKTFAAAALSCDVRGKVGELLGDPAESEMPSAIKRYQEENE